MAVKLGTYSKAIEHKTNAFELWCYRRMLRTIVGLLIPQSVMYYRKLVEMKHGKQKLVLCGSHNEKHITPL